MVGMIEKVAFEQTFEEEGNEPFDFWGKCAR